MPRVNTVAGYTVEQHSSPNVGGKMTDHRGLVLHIAEGSYTGTINWQMNPDQRYSSGGTVTTSSTWIVGRNPGEIAQMSDSDTIAWCQRSGSYTWNSVELAGYAPNPPTAWQIEACAHLLVWLHKTYGVPLQVTSDTSGEGLGHHSMDNDTTVEWGHDSCPGSGVINAKSTIVARAREILAGVEDDMTKDEMLALLRSTDGRNAIYDAVFRTDRMPNVYSDYATNPSQMAQSAINAISGDTAATRNAVAELAAKLGAHETADADRDAADATRDAELRELLAAHQSGQLSADEVVAKMAEALAKGSVA